MGLHLFPGRGLNTVINSMLIVINHVIIRVNMAEIPAAPMSLHYVLTLPTLLSALATLSSALFITPLVSQRGLAFYRESFSRKQKIYFDTLPGAIVHSTLVCVLIGIAIGSGSVSITESLAESKSSIGFTVMQIGAGFFVADMIICLSQESLREFNMTMHHVASLSSLLLGLIFEGRWMVLILAKFTTELSTPFVHLRWILGETKAPKNSPLTIFTAFSMTSTFLLTRLLALPGMWLIMYWTYVEEAEMPNYIPFVIKASVVLLMGTLDILNIYWAYKVIRGFLKWGKALLSSKKTKE